MRFKSFQYCKKTLISNYQNQQGRCWLAGYTKRDHSVNFNINFNSFIQQWFSKLSAKSNLIHLHHHQVTKRLEKTARYFKRLGTLGFWGQLVLTVVSAVILSFSTVVSGKITAPFTFYTTASSVVAAFVSIFWSFGYIRLSDRLRRTASEPAKVICAFW